ncbi:MAG: hypothetical protein Kow0031_06820 [Anaerolineae bacterium]
MHNHHTDAHCKELLGQLSDYIDGELEAALCAEIEAHIAGCHDCRVLVDTTKKTVALYRRRNTEVEAEISPDVSARLWLALRTAGVKLSPEE